MAFIWKRTRDKGTVYVADNGLPPGLRQRKTCASKAEAELVIAQWRVAGELDLDTARATARTAEKDLTVAAFYDRWRQRGGRKPSTVSTYALVWDVHLAKARVGTRAFPKMRLADVRQSHLLDLLSAKLRARGVPRNTDDGKVSAKTLALHIGMLSSMFEEAVVDGLIAVNPAKGLRRRLKLGALVREGRDATGVHAFSKEQQAALVAQLPAVSPLVGQFVLLGLRTGLRRGELLALRWEHIDEVSRELHVRQTMAAKSRERSTVASRLGSPKSGRTRRVHLSQETLRLLRDWRTAAKARALQAGVPFKMSDFLFAADGVHTISVTVIADGFAKLVRLAGLPGYFSPHATRHTYARRLLERGTPIGYVKDQLGHASITQTMDTYGTWLPDSDRSWVDHLDAFAPASGEAEAHLLVVNEGPRAPITLSPRRVTAASAPSKEVDEITEIPSESAQESDADVQKNFFNSPIAPCFHGTRCEMPEASAN